MVLMAKTPETAELSQKTRYIIYGYFSLLNPPHVQVDIF